MVACTANLVALRRTRRVELCGNLSVAALYLLLVVSVLIAFRIAARVFRVGILMHGQPPKLGEIIRWMVRKGS